MILFLSPKEEPNLLRLFECCERFGIDYLYLNPYTLYHDKFSLHLGHKSQTFGIEKFGELIDIDAVSGVWCRHPGLFSPYSIGSIENLRFYECRYVVNHICNSLKDATWMNDIYRIIYLNNRLSQTQWASDFGFLVPETLVTSKPGDAKEFLRKFGDIIIKRISGGGLSENADRILFTQKIDLSNIDILEQCAACPTLLQEPITKKLEFRVTVVGDDVFSAAIDSSKYAATLIDSRLWQLTDATYFRYPLPDSVITKILKMTKSLGLKYAAFDFILDKEENLYFLEFNCNGQWEYIEYHTGFAITERIVEVLSNE